MSRTPNPNCEECGGDPKGVLGFNAYTPCKTCNDLPLNGGEKDRATYDLRRELEKEKKRVIVPDDELRVDPGHNTALSTRTIEWTDAKWSQAPEKASSKGCYAR
jgi:hypothetical protein